MGSEVSYESELVRAQALRDKADKIEQAAFDRRPLPDKWRVGQMVRWIRSMDHGPSKGDIGYVNRLDTCDIPTRPSAYQVFWTGPKGKKFPSFWTTPSDVELVEDCK